MKRYTLVAAVALMVAVVILPCCAGTPPVAVHPGSSAPEFTLPTVEGDRYSLEGLMKGNAVVLMFISTQCPVSNAYNERMKDLCAEYTPKGVTFAAINSNKGNSPEEIERHARQHGFSFPVLRDAGNIVADRYGAQVTPEIFLIDHRGIVRYHGRIDDNPRIERVRSQDLRLALDALLAGKEIAVPETRAIGCGIERERKEGSE
jgi:peroxiredoxin